MFLPRTRRQAALMLAIFSVLGGLAWWQRAPWLAMYYVHCLSQADDANRDGWVARVVPLGDAAVPAILNALERADAKACANLEFALAGLVQSWGADDSRCLSLLEQVNAREPGAIGLHLAGALMDLAPGGRWRDSCRTLAVHGLGGAEPGRRLAALQLVLRPPFRQEHDLLVKVVPLLKDEAALVRKTALLALGQAPDLVSDDDLLPLLHDPDEDVQGLCELALRSRGLSEKHIYLARLISDERPAARLQVLGLLGEAGDLEPGVWLRRLCQDPAPAVRAAAIRAAVAQAHAELRGCLFDMARQDPSPTVRELAKHYLTRLTAN